VSDASKSEGSPKRKRQAKHTHKTKKSETTNHTKKEQRLCEILILSEEEVTSVHVISFKRIREFFSSHRDAEGSLTVWYKVTKKANWQNLAELKSTYPSADLVGRYVVFNIGGNKYRLIVGINYRNQTVFVKAVMTHEEYDLGKWKG